AAGHRALARPPSHARARARAPDRARAAARAVPRAADAGALPIRPAGRRARGLPRDPGRSRAHRHRSGTRSAPAPARDPQPGFESRRRRANCAEPRRIAMAVSRCRRWTMNDTAQMVLYPELDSPRLNYIAASIALVGGIAVCYFGVAALVSGSMPALIAIGVGAIVVVIGILFVEQARSLACIRVERRPLLRLDESGIECSLGRLAWPQIERVWHLPELRGESRVPPELLFELRPACQPTPPSED